MAVGDSETMIPREQDFEPSLATMLEAKPKVAFSAEDMTVENASCLEAKAKRMLSRTVQVARALSFPPPSGAPIVSQTTNRTTPTTTTTSCAITANDELIRTLRSIVHQNRRLPLEISKMFVDTVKPLLGVHRTAADKALGLNSGPAKTRPLPLPAQPSPMGTSTDSS